MNPGDKSWMQVPYVSNPGSCSPSSVERGGRDKSGISLLNHLKATHSSASFTSHSTDVGGGWLQKMEIRTEMMQV